jgi:hypothetical protein
LKREWRTWNGDNSLRLDKLFTFFREGAENGPSTVVKKEDVDEYFVVGSSTLRNSIDICRPKLLAMEYIVFNF